NLEPISSAPSDEQVTKVHEAIRSYQKYSEIPSMFEPQVHAELSQHLFDIQMARYMSSAAQRQPSSTPHETTQYPTSSRVAERAVDVADETIAHNNAGSGSSVTESRQLQDTGIRDILERSNQLAERANQLSERSNQLIERSNQIAEQSNQPTERPRPDGPVEQSADRSNQLAERFNELTGQLNQYFSRSNQLVEEYKKPVEQLGDVLRTINKVLVGIQHAIVRNCMSNTEDAVRCLVNEKGDTPKVPSDLWGSHPGKKIHLQLAVGDVYSAIVDKQVAYFLRFYDIQGEFFKDHEKTELRDEQANTARKSLEAYWASALGM
ncbi:hypothetical protein FRC11_006104, partial [Ceratobasidium sp. 423]